MLSGGGLRHYFKWEMMRPTIDMVTLSWAPGRVELVAEQSPCQAKTWIRGNPSHRPRRATGREGCNPRQACTTGLPLALQSRYMMSLAIFAKPDATYDKVHLTGEAPHRACVPRRGAPCQGSRSYSTMLCRTYAPCRGIPCQDSRSCPVMLCRICIPCRGMLCKDPGTVS